MVECIRFGISLIAMFFILFERESLVGARTISALIVLVLFFSLFHSSCGKQPTIAPLRDDAVILAFGDSLTAGTGASEKTTYPAVLARLIGYTVINAGIPGETSAEGAERLATCLDRYAPDIVILCHGGNDILQKTDTKATIQNLRTMIETIQSRNISILLIGVPKPGLGLKAAPFYKDIAHEYGIAYEGEALAEILSTPSLKSDYVHPNAEGYARLAGSVAALIQRSASP